MPLFTRSSHNPILRPDPEHAWESLKVYNPGALYHDGQYHLFYRAVGKGDDWHSSIGYAVSGDAEHFKRFSEPILAPSGLQEKRGIEDPRISKVADTFYLAYTAYDGRCARLSLAASLDLKVWEKHGEMIPDWNAAKAGAFTVPWDEAQHNGIAIKHWSKAGGIFPEIIGNGNHHSFGAMMDKPYYSAPKAQGRYWMIFGSRHLWLAASEDGLTWQADPKPFLRPRAGDFFDSVHLEMGPPPLKTAHGWLVIYHGIDNQMVYRLGFVLLALDDPKKILYRSDKPIFEPSAPYEMAGLIDILPGGLEELEALSDKELNRYIHKLQNKHRLPHVIFCCGAVLKNDSLRIYYGAGDTYICTATADINDILKSIA